METAAAAAGDDDDDEDNDDDNWVFVVVCDVDSPGGAVAGFCRHSLEVAVANLFYRN